VNIGPVCPVYPVRSLSVPVTGRGEDGIQLGALAQAEDGHSKVGVALGVGDDGGEGDQPNAAPYAAVGADAGLPP
jgi:hypothetical protein